MNCRNCGSGMIVDAKGVRECLHCGYREPLIDQCVFPLELIKQDSQQLAERCMELEREKASRQEPSASIQRFEFKGHEVRTVVKDGEPWWVAKDVCDILEMGNYRSSLALLEEDEKGVHTMDTPGGPQQMAVVSEPGLYSLILRSRKPEAREFKRWVTHEVLPQIRKTGIYAPNIPKTLPEALRAYASEIEKREQIEQQLKIAAPKVEFYDQVAGSADAIDMREVAAVLNRPGWGRNTIFDFLRKSGVLDNNNVPYRRYQDAGYFRVIEQKYTDASETRINLKTLVYQKGVDWIGRLIQRYEDRRSL